jgi:hypothetical protein
MVELTGKQSNASPLLLQATQFAGLQEPPLTGVPVPPLSTAAAAIAAFANAAPQMPNAGVRTGTVTTPGSSGCGTLQ